MRFPTDLPPAPSPPGMQGDAPQPSTNLNPVWVGMEEAGPGSCPELFSPKIPLGCSWSFPGTRICCLGYKQPSCQSRLGAQSRGGTQAPAWLRLLPLKPSPKAGAGRRDAGGSAGGPPAALSNHKSLPPPPGSPPVPLVRLSHRRCSNHSGDGGCCNAAPMAPVPSQPTQFAASSWAFSSASPITSP